MYHYIEQDNNYIYFLKIIDQCGRIHIRKEIFDNNQKFHNEYRNSVLLILDKYLRSMRQSLQIYRSFWTMLPKQICKSNELSTSNEKEECWTGTSISQDQGQKKKFFL